MTRSDPWRQGNAKPNKVLGRTVWSTPQTYAGKGIPACCNSCKFFANHHVKVSELARHDVKGIVAEEEAMTFGACQNVRIWAAFGKERAPITRSYHYCNFYEEKENGTRRKR